MLQEAPKVFPGGDLTPAQVLVERWKVVTREPDLVRELRRCGLREKWGLSLVHR